MRIGRLANRVELYAPTVSSDGQGGYTTSFALDSTRWADVRRVSGTRGFELGQMLDAEPYDITMRDDSSLTTSWILKFDGKELVIHSIVRDFHEYGYMTVTAYERQND